MIQCSAVPVPEVGSRPSPTEKTRIATIATQKSGALAPASDAVLAILSNRLFGRAAASDRETERKNDRDHGELQRLRKGFERDFHGRPVAAQRVPEIESGEIDQVTAELHDKRIVEAVRLREGLTLRFGRIERQIEIGRIAGKPREEEDEHQKSDHRDQALAGASENESEHGVSFPP
jgi:hypothetical protein